MDGSHAVTDEITASDEFQARGLQPEPNHLAQSLVALPHLGDALIANHRKSLLECVHDRDWWRRLQESLALTALLA